MNVVFYMNDVKKMNAI